MSALMLFLLLAVICTKSELPTPNVISAYDAFALPKGLSLGCHDQQAIYSQPLALDLSYTGDQVTNMSELYSICMWSTSDLRFCENMYNGEDQHIAPLLHPLHDKRKPYHIARLLANLWTLIDSLLWVFVFCCITIVAFPKEQNKAIFIQFIWFTACANCANLEISAGLDRSCAFNTVSMKCWGAGAHGALGYGDVINRGNATGQMGDNLTAIDLGSNFQPAQISMGNYFSCVLSTGNAVKCWGQNMYGNLGYGDTRNRGGNPGEMGDNLLPLDLGTNVNAIQITTGLYHGCALTSSNSVKCWGYNAQGHLGYGDVTTRGNTDYQMGDILPFVALGTGFITRQIASGSSHTCALSDGGAVKCWGQNSQGTLGYGDTVTRGDEPGEMGDNLPFVDLGTNFTPTQIVGGGGYSCALSSDGSVKCFGQNSYGNLGYGDVMSRGREMGQMGDDLPIVDLGTNFTVTQITAGLFHTCALSESNAVKCWGQNMYGNLGYGDTANRGDNPNEMGENLLPLDLGTNFRAVQIAAGAFHTCAVSDMNLVKCWGQNTNGELGYGDIENRGGNPGEMGNNLLPVDLGAFTTGNPSKHPSLSPTKQPSLPPSKGPTAFPTNSPTLIPSQTPTQHPTKNPTASPTYPPTLFPSSSPSKTPTISPSVYPSMNPTKGTIALDSSTSLPSTLSPDTSDVILDTVLDAGAGYAMSQGIGIVMSVIASLYLFL